MKNDKKNFVLGIGYVTLLIVLGILVFSGWKKLYVSLFVIVWVNVLHYIAGKFKVDAEDVNNTNSVEQVKESNADQDCVEDSSDEYEDESDDETDDEEECIEVTKEEAQYLEEVKFFMEENNGVISSKARDILQRKSQRWGISEERANELEQLFSSASNTDYTDEEKEYIEIYQELSADGEITERKRRMLERERQSFGISEERAKELESEN